MASITERPAPPAPPPALTDADVRDIARDAVSDVRTVLRRIAGLPVRGAVGVRIDRELARRRESTPHALPPMRAA
jgi:hypothetical protein